MENNEHWTVYTWAGQDAYRCNYCKFNDADQGRMIHHYQEHHAPVPEPKPTILIADASGREIGTNHDLTGAEHG